MATRSPNKFVVHAVGGCGISVADKVLSRVADLGEGYAEFEFNYVDASRANIDNIKPRGEFWQIDQQNADGSRIDGSGGERHENADSIVKCMAKYLDDKDIRKPVTGIYHMVVSSVSGGSGSVFAAVLIQEFLRRGIPVLPVLIGDTSDRQKIQNTVKSFQSLSNYSFTMDKPIVVYYVDNRNKQIKLKDREKYANDILFRDLSAISIFFSGMNESIDYADMIGMLYPSFYTSFKIKCGVHQLQVFDKEPPYVPDIDPDEKNKGDKYPEGFSSPLIGRVLTDADGNFDINFSLYQYKIGKIISQNVLQKYTTGQSPYLPLYMFVMNDPFTSIITECEENLIPVYKQADDDIKSTDLCAMTNAKVDEKTGLVL
ncbi:MAG: hypothetical protein K2M73_09505 [Lachnospiraceae bacterium]|nr:hypothetical protein [Lachnospiraceae bacterium]